MNTPILLFISIFSGAAYAFLLYSKKSPWNQETNIFIALLRFISVALLVFMILSPFINSKQIIKEKSTFVIAIDNSSSVKDGLKNKMELLRQAVTRIKETIGDKFDVRLFTLDGSFNRPVEELGFYKKESDLSFMINTINNSLESDELKGMVLLTDGIFNKGSSPLYYNYNYPVFGVGIGDTITPKDVIIRNCLYNNIVGKNNRFPINVEVKSYGYKDKKVTVSLFSGKNKLQSKSILIQENEFTKGISFESIEKEAGLKHYTLTIEPLAGEFSLKNNQKEIYFDVIEAKQKIAILASAPHPDIKAIVSSLSSNENTEIETFIEGVNPFSNLKFDLMIAYQLPGINSGFNAHIAGFLKDNTPVLFVLGGNSSLSEANILVPNLKILSQPGQFDKVTGILNPAFSRLNFNPKMPMFLEKNPPLIVPFGSYNLGLGWDVVLNQKVGAIATDKPLLALFNGEGRNYGILFGEGIWQWRMNEFAENQNNEVFDDLIKKITTLLAQKTDKRKFRCNPSERSFEENTPVLFKIETYNDIYEPVFGQEIDITIKNDKGNTFKYKFQNSVEDPNFEITGLKSGVYSFTSKTILSGKEQVVKGEFSIQNIDLEDQTQVADFELLRNISNQTNGKFYNMNQVDNLVEELNSLDAKEKVFKIESILEIINLKALFFVILSILAIEWAFRKNLGQV